jgi:hypothetical protein
VVKVEIRLGPEYDVYPPTSSEPLSVVEDPVTCARIVDALQDDGLEHDVVLQAHGSLSLVCYGAGDEFLTTVTVLPGWIRYGAPDDSRLATNHLMSLLEELGVSYAFSRAAWQAVDDVEPRFPAATRKNATEDDGEHAQPGEDSPTLCGIPADAVTMYRHLFTGRGTNDCLDCSRRSWRSWTDRRPASAPNPLASELTARWQQRWPGSRPIAHEIRATEHERWVRFHSLPESRRYATSPAEYDELLRRHATAISELISLAHSDPGEVLVITCAWSSGPTAPLRSAPVVEVSPDAFYWQSILLEEDEDGQRWLHLFVDLINPDDARLTMLLRIVADDQTADVIIADRDLTWLYHPYDGGADLIAATPADHDHLREQHPDWLSRHPAGL